MLSGKFNNAADIVRTREVLGMLPEDAEHFLLGDAQITEDTKTALLIAQAAERAYKLADRAGVYAQKHDVYVEHYKTINEGVHPQLRGFVNEKEAGVVAYDDPVFKFVGSEKDPEALKVAQATWMAAQMYMNHEIRAIKEAITHAELLGKAATTGAAYADGFKKFAGELYVLAAEMLDKDGHAAAAGKLEAVGKAMVKYGVDNQNAPKPAQFLNHLLSQERGVKSANSTLNEDYRTPPIEYENTIIKLIKLTTPPKSPPEAKTVNKP
jgi:hypothetical protein